MSRSLVAATLLLLIADVPFVGAQTPSGEISGVVTDSAGRQCRGRGSRSQPGHQRRPRSSDQRVGAVRHSGDPAGPYTLKAELRASARSSAGTSRCRSAARTASRSRSKSASCRNVQVAAVRRCCRARTASIGTVIENRSIVELPLNGRNYLQLASLIPGATTNGPSSSQGRQRMGGQRNSFALNVAGQRVHYNHYSLDGIENTDLNFNSYMLLPSVDALQEFKVGAGLFDAEYGRAIAQINASTKSGTNQFHGTVFEFLRNSALDAKNYFDPADRPIPPFKRNQYGLTVGGPVVIPKVVDGRNKLFFMFNWEGLRERKALTSSPSVPLTAWRTGDFSQLRDASGNLIPIYDPATRVFDAAGNVIAGADAVPWQHHSGQPDPSGVATAGRLLSAAGLERTGANFTNDEARRVDADQFTYRFDFIESATIELVLPSQPLARARLRPVRRSRTWASTPTPTCTRWCSATRARSARTRSTSPRSASAT